MVTTLNGCDEIGNRGKFRPYREIVEGSTPSNHIKYLQYQLGSNELFIFKYCFCSIDELFIIIMIVNLYKKYFLFVIKSIYKISLTPFFMISLLLKEY